MTTAERIAERIKSVLEARSRSVSWLSATTGIADKTLRRRLIKPAHLTFEELSAVCSALEISVEDVLNPDVPATALTERVSA